MSQRITWVDKTTVNPSPLPENNKFTGKSTQEVKDVVNSHADDIEALEASSGGGGLLEAHIKLTQSQIQNLFSTPIEIISAPGIGKYIEIFKMSSFFNDNGTDYTTVGLVYAKYVSGGISGSAETWSTDSIDQSPGDTVNTWLNSPGLAIMNNAIEVKSQADDVAAGGIMDIFISYEIRDTN